MYFAVFGSSSLSLAAPTEPVAWIQSLLVIKKNMSSNIIKANSYHKIGDITRN